MVREIIIPVKSNITLNLPLEMIGKTVEVIAFEIDTVKNNFTKEQRLSQIDGLTKDTLTNLSSFKFDRNEANNYDE